MILDASAVLAFLNDEPGADTVADAIPGALISAANLAEVLGKVGDWGGDIVGIEERLRAAGLQVAPVQADDAVVVAALRQLDGGTALSLGDRCCLTSVCGTARQQCSPPTAPGRSWTYHRHRTDPMSCLVGQLRPYEGESC